MKLGHNRELMNFGGLFETWVSRADYSTLLRDQCELVFHVSLASKELDKSR
jgi:hypothetical protein